MEAADILAAHGDHDGALAHLEACLRSSNQPDLPAAWALKRSEQQRLHSLWMKQGTLEACEKVSGPSEVCELLRGVSIHSLQVAWTVWTEADSASVCLQH